jgi:hypothetical protein
MWEKILTNCGFSQVSAEILAGPQADKFGTPIGRGTA